MPLINAIVNKMLGQFFPLSGYRSLHFFHCVKFSSMVAILLKGPPNSIVNRFKIGDVWGPRQARWNQYSLSSDNLWYYELCAPAHHPVEMSICVGDILLGYQATDPFPERIKNGTNYWPLCQDQWRSCLSYPCGALRPKPKRFNRSAPVHECVGRWYVRPFCNKLYTNTIMT